MKRRILIVSILTVLLVGAVLWVSRSPSARQTITLGDGSTVSLLRVTYGKKHRCVFGPPWERMLVLLPEKLLRRFGIQSAATFTSTNDSLVIWLEWRGSAAPVYRELSVVDETGIESGTSGWSYSASPAGRTDLWQGQELPAYPRRADRFKLRIRQQSPDTGERKIVADLTIPNPAPKPSPRWTAEPLPIRKSDKEMEFTLTHLSVAASNLTNLFDQGGWARAGFRIATEDRLLTNWQPEKIWMTDATGNRCESTSWSNESRDGEEKFQFRWPLWPDEVWKLRVEFARKAAFLSEDLWTVQGIALPGRSTNTFQTNLHGVTIRIRGLTDSSGRLPDGGRGRFMSGTPSLNVTVSPELEGWRLKLVSVRDDLGHEVRQKGVGWGGGQYSYGLDLPDDAKSIDVTLAHHQSRFVEFLAQPAVRTWETND